MIFVAYTRVDADACALEASARRLFPSSQGLRYIDEICVGTCREAVCERLAALVLLGALCEKAGISTAHNSPIKDAQGKPHFEGLPFDFSITHSRGIVAVALGNSGKLGIDIEASEPDAKKAKRLAKRYFSEREAEGVMQSHEEFARLWTKKEAAFKLLGGSLTEILSKDSESLFEDEKVFYNFYEIYGYPLTLCTESKQKDIEIFEQKLI